MIFNNLLYFLKILWPWIEALAFQKKCIKWSDFMAVRWVKGQLLTSLSLSNKKALSTFL